MATITFELGAGVGYAEHRDGSHDPDVWLVSLETNQIFALGSPGSAIWLEALQADTSIDVVNRLAQKYDWDSRVIEVDVTNFVGNLVTRGWLKEKVNP